MKSTGVIRRIDDLGRIVIPKEIRSNFRIKSGESLEIYTSGDEIVLKKYSPVKGINNLIQTYIDATYETIKHSIIITDRDHIIASSNNISNNYIGREISDYVDRMIERRDSFIERHMKEVKFINDKDETCCFSFSPIISDSDLIGSVIIFSTDIPINETDEKMVIVLSKLLSNCLNG